MAKVRVGKGFVSVYNFQVTLCPGRGVGETLGQEVKQGRNLKVSPEADAMEECY